MTYSKKTAHRMLVTEGRSAGLGTALVLTALLSGCGGGAAGGGAASGGAEGIAGGAGKAAADQGGEAGEASSGIGGAAGAIDCDKRTTETSPLNESIFHSGFELQLGSAVLTPATANCAPGDLAVDAVFRNRGTDTFQFDGDMLLTSHGHDYARSYATDIPTVPGLRTGKGTLHFDVDSAFVLDEATLIVGGAGEHQAIVPLGAKSPDTFVSLVAPDAPLMGKFTAGTLEFNMKGGYIRVDQPWDHTTLDEKHYSVTLLFSATYTASNGGGNNISSDNFDLALPDGTAVAPDDASDELLDNVGTTLDDLYMTFTIPGPMEGKFAVEASGRWGQNAAAVSIAMPFTVPHIAAFGK